jgi:UDPglucose 6-dehydrogenase
MRVVVVGESYLAQVTRLSLDVLGVESIRVSDRGGPLQRPIDDLVVLAEDVYDHEDLWSLVKCWREIVEYWREPASPKLQSVPIVVMSQVPPGWVRSVVESLGSAGVNVFYHIDTLIVRRAVDRMVRPEQVVVGCAQPSDPLPLGYQGYLARLQCPVLQMSYESAEMAKLAINCFLSEQVHLTTKLSRVAESVGASWSDVASALKNDRRIGKHAYLRPGTINQHLSRDYATFMKILSGLEDGDGAPD